MVSDGVVITEASLDPRVEAALRERAGEPSDFAAFVLPTRVDDGDDGSGDPLYSEDAARVVQGLRDEGVPVTLVHKTEDRLYLSEYSEDLLLGLALGVGSNMTWDAAKGIGRYLIAYAAERQSARGTKPQLVVSIASIETADGAKLRNVEIRGPADGVAVQVVEEIGRWIRPE